MARHWPSKIDYICILMSRISCQATLHEFLQNYTNFSKNSCHTHSKIKISESTHLLIYYTFSFIDLTLIKVHFLESHVFIVILVKRFLIDIWLCVVLVLF